MIQTQGHVVGEFLALERDQQNDPDDVSLPIIKFVYLFRLIYRITLVQKGQLFHPRARNKFMSPLSS